MLPYFHVRGRRGKWRKKHEICIHCFKKKLNEGKKRKIQFRLYSFKKRKQLLAYSLLGFFMWRRFRVRYLFCRRYFSKNECAKELSRCFKFAELIVILYKGSGFHAFGTYWKKAISSEKEVLGEKLYEVIVIAIVKPQKLKGVVIINVLLFAKLFLVTVLYRLSPELTHFQNVVS